MDAFLLREGQNIITTVYRKVTNSDIYYNWNSLGTFFKIFGSKSTFSLLNRRFIENWVTAYTESFSWGKWLSTLSYKTNQIFAEEVQKSKHQNIQGNDNNVTNTECGNRRHLLVLPYHGQQGSRLVKSLKQKYYKATNQNNTIRVWICWK